MRKWGFVFPTFTRLAFYIGGYCILTSALALASGLLSFLDCIQMAFMASKGSGFVFTPWQARGKGKVT